MTSPQTPIERSDVLELLYELMGQVDDLPDPLTPLGQLTREFLDDSWQELRDGLLRKTTRLRIVPQPAPTPRVFHFEIDLPFKSKLGPDSPVLLMEGPIRGTIIYRPDMLSNLYAPCVAVQLDPSQGFFHPNCFNFSSPQPGMLCLGDTTEFQGPVPLDALVLGHLYPILSYQKKTVTHPANLEAALYFASNLEAMVGLEPVPPLY